MGNLHKVKFNDEYRGPDAPIKFAVSGLMKIQQSVNIFVEFTFTSFSPSNFLSEVPVKLNRVFSLVHTYFVTVNTWNDVLHIEFRNWRRMS